MHKTKRNMNFNPTRDWVVLTIPHKKVTDSGILLSDEGEVYLKLDEETFGTNEALRMMFKIAQNPNLSNEKKMTNREIGLRKLISQQWQASVFSRILAWMRNGRLGR